MAQNMDNRVLYVGAVGTRLSITKEPEEQMVHTIHFGDYLQNSGTTLASVSAVTIAPVDATNAPTAVLGTVGPNSVPLTVAAGLPAWGGGSGKGTISFVATMADGDKKEVNIDVLIEEV